jgi:hypothetical protein
MLTMTVWSKAFYPAVRSYSGNGVDRDQPTSLEVQSLRGTTSRGRCGVLSIDPAPKDLRTAA